VKHLASAAGGEKETMDAMEALKAACIEASEAAAHIEARVKDKLLKRAQTYRVTEAEAFDLAETWMRQMTLLARPSKALSGSMAINASASREATAQTVLGEVS
jgi:hypothetical protein